MHDVTGTFIHGRFHQGDFQAVHKLVVPRLLGRGIGRGGWIGCGRARRAGRGVGAAGEGLEVPAAAGGGAALGGGSPGLAAAVACLAAWAAASFSSSVSSRYTSTIAGTSSASRPRSVSRSATC